MFKKTPSCTDLNKKWQHIYSTKQFTKEDIEELCSSALQMKEIVEKQGKIDLLNGKVLALLFFEPSTRTSCSFHAAALRLGASVMPVDISTSSTKKGESLSDTLRTLACFCDAIVMRHPEKGIFEKMIPHMQSTNVPLINGGDGDGEHPTQALLDILTIMSELGHVNNITVTMCGDLKFGRTVHSLSQMLSLFSNITINYVAPSELQMPQHLADQISNGSNNTVQKFYTELSDAILSHTDVLYLTRLQRERFNGTENVDEIVRSYVVTTDTLKSLKSTGIVMHPLPRVQELHESVDVHRSCVYFKQMEYGMYMRMALLAAIL
jgi:aspartate carbamoyltransferase